MNLLFKTALLNDLFFFPAKYSNMLALLDISNLIYLEKLTTIFFKLKLLFLEAWFFYRFKNALFVWFYHSLDYISTVF